VSLIGKTLRQYRIEAQLGAGNGGTVYRARDTQLERVVAIRIFPGASRPAQFPSGLSHRNIVTVYDIDTAEVDGQPVDFIAMEYAPGKTLDQLIGRKGLRPSEALRYAIQIADGLAAAHAAGVVHGNLKSANVVVNKQGEVKILDLGLAEQSDVRDDIFSFGQILHQMICGERAGDALSLAPVQGVPRELERILARCLHTDPQRRWQSIADIGTALEDVLTDLDTSKKMSRVSTGRRRWGLALGVTLLLLALAGGTYLGAHRIAPQPTFQRLTYQRGDVSGARFSPDGQSVFFSAQWATDPTRIFSMRPGSSESSPLDLPEARIVSISSSGEMALLLGSPASGAPGTLARVPLSGGTPRSILENVNDADWSPDGSRLAVSHTVGGRNRIEYPVGTVLDESSGRPPLSLRVSPKGDRIAFFEYDNAVGDFAVTVLDLQGKKRTLSRGWTGEGGLAWSPGEEEVWFSGTKSGGEPALRAVALNGKERLIAQRPAFMLLDDVTRDGRALVAVSDSRLGISGLAPGAREEQDLSWFDASRIHDISADGALILFVELSYGQPRNPAIYLRKTDGSPAIRLGDGNRPALSPDGKWVACIVSDGPRTTLTLLPTGPGETRTLGEAAMHYDRVEWFPDGQRILFEANEPNRPARTFTEDLNGGVPVPLTPEGMDSSHVSPDGKYVTISAAGRLSLFPIGGGQTKPIANLGPGESVIRWSGDGRYLFLRTLVAPAVLNIYRLDVASGRKELWKQLKAPDPVGVQIGPVVLTPDGNSYAYSFQREVVTLYLGERLR